MKNSRTYLITALLGLLAVIPIADAQRGSNAGVFEGDWLGILTMDVIYDVPGDLIEPLSKPVELDLRIFRRGTAEIRFTGEEDIWDFQDQRGVGGVDFRITMIGDDNAVMIARPNTEDTRFRNSFAFSFAKPSENELLINWSRFTVRNQTEGDGLDTFGLSGTAVLLRADD